MSTSELAERAPADDPAEPPAVPAALAPHPVSGERARQLAAEGGLRPVNELAPFGDYVRGIWQRRHFLWALASSRFSVANSQDRLGAGWNILRPLFQAAVYTVIFSILITGAKPPNYPEYVTAGVFVYTFLSGCLISGASAVVGELGLVRSIKFPRAVLPLSGTTLNLLGFLPAIGVLAVLLLVVSAFRGQVGETLSWSWLLVVPATALMTVFSAGAALLCARMTVIIRDFSQLLPFALRLMFYLSGTIVDVTRLSISMATGADGRPTGELSPLGLVLAYEPFHVYMELVRGVLLPAQPVTLTYWVWGVVWAVLSFAVGLTFFWRGERDYGK